MVDAAHLGGQLHQLLEREYFWPTQIERLANRVGVLQTMRDGAGHVFHPNGLKAGRRTCEWHEREDAL